MTTPKTPPLNPDENIEKMLEMAQSAKGKPSEKGGIGKDIKTALGNASKLADPNDWVRELYGISPSEQADKAKDEKEKKPDNHTPLDASRLPGQDVSPTHQHFFKKYKEEYEQFLSQKKQENQKTKREEEEEEKRKKEEERRKKEEESQQEEVHGKPKYKLGQPKRKATTEMHPETKMGGAK